MNHHFNSNFFFERLFSLKLKSPKMEVLSYYFDFFTIYLNVHLNFIVDILKPSHNLIINPHSPTYSVFIYLL